MSPSSFALTTLRPATFWATSMIASLLSAVILAGVGERLRKEKNQGIDYHAPSKSLLTSDSTTVPVKKSELTRA